MSPPINPLMSFPERLRTFQGYWDDNEATARQLAALGHVYDGFAALEEGSYCISCNAFVEREVSIAALEGPLSRAQSSSRIFISAAHRSNCTRWQTRIPLDTRSPPDLSLRHHRRVDDTKKVFDEPPDSPADANPPSSTLHNSSLFILPTELRLKIYSLVMPTMNNTTTRRILPTEIGSCPVSATMDYTKSREHDAATCNILRVNRAFYNDAHDMLFAGRTYAFSSTKILYTFLRAIGAHGRQLLKSVDIVYGHREDAVALSLLAACPELRTITLRIAKTKLLDPHAGRPPIWVVDGLASLLELSGLQAVTFGCCRNGVPSRDDKMHDAEILRRELMRPRGAESGVRWVDGLPDL